VIARSLSNDYSIATGRLSRALSEFHIEGVGTNLPFLRRLIAHPDIPPNKIHTSFVLDNIRELVSETADQGRSFHAGSANGSAGARQAGTTVDATDPLASLNVGKGGVGGAVAAAGGGAGGMMTPDDFGAPEGVVMQVAPMQGTIVSVAVAEGDEVRREMWLGL
jgi:acetyl-CoA/propionyl-CoA carboxylase biotin carboxyl carrier protein